MKVSKAEASTGVDAGQTGRWHLGSLLAVLVGEISGQVCFKLPIVAVNGGSQSGFGGAALTDALEDGMDIAEPIGIVDVGHGSQRFGVGHVSFGSGEALKAAFQGIQWDVALRFEKQRELVSFAAEALGLKELSDALVQPGRTAASG